jgi:hypothetical protein
MISIFGHHLLKLVEILGTNQDINIIRSAHSSRVDLSNPDSYRIPSDDREWNRGGLENGYGFPKAQLNSIHRFPNSSPELISDHS